MKVSRLGRMTANIYRKYLSPFGVTDSQLTLLFIICKVGGLTQKEISEMIKLEKSTLTRNLKRLIENKYIHKDNYPIIGITDAGMLLLDDIVPEWDKAMAEIRSIIMDDGEDALDLILNKFQPR